MPISHTFAKRLLLACLYSFNFRDYDVSMNPKLFLPLENKSWVSWFYSIFTQISSLEHRLTSHFPRIFIKHRYEILHERPT